MQKSSAHLASDDVENEERNGRESLSYPPRSRPNEPEPKPYPAQEDGTVAEWWDCSKCGERANPPLSQWCFGCSAKRPKASDSAAEPLPKATDWKSLVKKIVVYGAVLGAVLGFVSFFFPILKPIVTVIKAIVAALSGLQL